MWLYISWLILLVGAQASFYLQFPEYLRVGYRQLKIGGQLREQVAVSIMLIMARQFRSERSPLSSNEIARQLDVSGLVLSAVAQRLRSAGLIAQAGQDKILPNRDPGIIPVSAILNAVRAPQDGDMFQDGRWPDQVNRLFSSLGKVAAKELDNRSLYDLLEGEDNGEVVAPQPD